MYMAVFVFSFHFIYNTPPSAGRRARYYPAQKTFSSLAPYCVCIFPPTAPRPRPTRPGAPPPPMGAGGRTDG